MTSFKWLFKIQNKKKWKFSDLRNQAKVGLVLDVLVFHWFMSLIKNKSGSYRAAFNYTLQWTSYFFQSFNSRKCHFACRVCTELQNPLPHECKGKLSLRKRGSLEDQGWGKEFFAGSHPSSTTVTSPEGQGWSFGCWILQLHPIMNPSVKTVSSKIR